MKNTFAVDFSLSVASKDCNFENLVKKYEAQIVELGEDGSPIKIKYPISGNVYLIEYDDTDKFSLTGCTWIVMHLLDNRCRVFSSKNRFFVSTFLSKAELKKLIDELVQKMYSDYEFWDMLKCYEALQKWGII